ncbi:MAG: hypothetical protein GF346_01915 [Candidatus Eisenbacteria bacterium]|nr:hypothetical protein [Candidatus Latescibacterota bacterium]MBD3301187.1 hypothetical protein [Candidatus Eisenbacteria bacterium]
MPRTIGIRREDKNEWERRVPLIPEDLAALQRELGLRVLVQPSANRAYADHEFMEAGILVQEDLDPAEIVFAVKEVPVELLQEGKTYVYFSHVIKGQSYNLPMLQRLLDLGCSLVDYERILDDRGRRRIFFGVHAGYAGMIETLRCLGTRWAAEDRTTPLAEVRPAYRYESLEAAMAHLRSIGERIAGGELDPGLRPIVVGIAGYGNVSRGAQEILSCLPVAEVSPADLASAAIRREDGPVLLKVVFREEDMVRPKEGRFDLQDYYERPERYEGRFADYLPHLDVLVNTTYWDERYPRLVTKRWVGEHYRERGAARLAVIGDISCDIEGGIEPTLHVTRPDEPCFVYDAGADAAVPGSAGPGPAIMAVDNLPCEFSREASMAFSNALRGMVDPLARADWGAEFKTLELPASLKRAVIVHRGDLTPPYEYLRRHLAP